jgi:hypothetical protein
MTYAENDVNELIFKKIMSQGDIIYPQNKFTHKQYVDQLADHTR